MTGIGTRDGDRDKDRVTLTRRRDWGMLFFSSSTITPKRTKAVPCRRFPYRYLWTSHHCHRQPLSPCPHHIHTTVTPCPHIRLSCNPVSPCPHHPVPVPPHAHVPLSSHHPLPPPPPSPCVLLTPRPHHPISPHPHHPQTCHLASTPPPHPRALCAGAEQECHPPPSPTGV